MEAVYQEALALELSALMITFQREVELPVYYKGMLLSTAYRVDFVCYDTVIVELKALSKLSANEEAQIINYQKAGEKEIGLLINFGAKSLEYHRFVRTK